MDFFSDIFGGAQSTNPQPVQNNQNNIPIINNGNVINNKINNKIIPPIKERNSPNQNFNITSKDKL